MPQSVATAGQGSIAALSAQGAMLILCALLPAVLAVVLLRLGKSKVRWVHRLSGRTRQMAAGLVFGLAAIAATVLGPEVDGAVLNVRAAEPLCAGLIFGGPAGILAGLIGGAYRYAASFWGVGTFTQLGCSIATVLAGVLAALMRRWIFDQRIPRWIFGLLAGACAEAVDMLLIFATNMSDVAAAFAVVQACALPMICLNGGACALAVGISRRSGSPAGRSAARPELAASFQRWLGAIMFGAFLAAVSFIWSLQTIAARSDTQSLLERSLSGFLAAAQSTVQGEAVADAAQIGRTVQDAAGQSQERVLRQIVRGSDVEQVQLLNPEGALLASVGGEEGSQGDLAADFREMRTEIGSHEDYDWVSDWSPDVMHSGISAIVRLDSGYLAAHWGGSWVRRKLDDVLQDQALEFHVGGSSGIILAARDGTVISQMTGDGADQMRDAVTRAKGSPGFGEMFTADVYGVPSLCMYAESGGGDIVFASQPVREAFFERDMNQYLVVLLELLIFAVLFFLIYALVKYLVVDRILQINAGLQAIVAGDLNVAVDVRSSQEFSRLSDDINATVSSLKDHIAAEAARLDEELEFARAVQVSALPENFPEQDTFSLYAFMHAAKEVGGDFYDFFMPDPQHIAMLIADVSGKGIPAAMFMMKAKTLLHNLVQRGHPPQEVLRLANNELCENNAKDMFVTAWLGIADLESGNLRFACAGHNPPLIRDGSGSWTFLRRKGGFVLGGMPDMSYHLFELHLEPSSMLFLYTDGMTEAINRDQEEFGEERLRHVLESLREPDCRAVCTAAAHAVETFAADEPQFDDMTMLAFLYNGEDSGVMKKIILEPQSAQAASLADFVEEVLGAEHVPADVAARVGVACDEVFSNICRYSGAREVVVSCGVTGETILLEFRDDGAPYDPTGLREVDVVSGADERQPGGLGIFLVQNIMDSLSYSYVDGENILKMQKAYSRTAPGADKE